CGTLVSGVPEPVLGTKGVVKDFLSRWQRVAVPGPVASEADRLAEELEHYDRLLEANPNLERAWSNRAKVLDKLGRTKEAAESLAKAAELNPAREEQYRLDVQNILRSKEDASVIAPQWKQPAPTAAPKVVDTHLIEALEHYDSLLRADRSRGRSHLRPRRHERVGQWERLHERPPGTTPHAADPGPASLVPIGDRDRRSRCPHGHRPDPREHALPRSHGTVLDHPD